jgi:hypothetical protein
MLKNDTLTDLQKKVLAKFYSAPNKKLSYDQVQRRRIWDNFVKTRKITDLEEIKVKTPALYEEVARALVKGKNIQSAVFSECVYTQELARIFALGDFENNVEKGRPQIDFSKLENSKFNELTIRYTYHNTDKTNFLFQAGGAGGVDCALYSKIDNEVSMIELKEPYARTSDPNLPKYGEDGILLKSERFAKKYPQLMPMLEEQLDSGLNVFDHLGSNVSNFSPVNIEKAVSENYSGEKFADFICTEDESGFLVMLRSKDVSRWATLEGELRPSGRNKAKVWTPRRLVAVLEAKGARISDSKVEILSSELKPANARGGSQVSRQKIDPAFFIYLKDLKEVGPNSIFDIKNVWQLIPSITAKMNFKGLKLGDVKSYYSELAE